MAKNLFEKTIKSLESKVLRTEKDNQYLYLEMAERGKELEKLRTLIEGWEAQIPKELYNKLILIIGGYVVRSTEKYSRNRLMIKYGLKDGKKVKQKKITKKAR